jgi:hypothetical protein
LLVLNCGRDLSSVGHAWFRGSARENERNGAGSSVSADRVNVLPSVRGASSSLESPVFRLPHFELRTSSFTPNGKSQIENSRIPIALLDTVSNVSDK